jgi:hypothetical protein
MCRHGGAHAGKIGEAHIIELDDEIFYPFVREIWKAFREGLSRRPWEPWYKVDIRFLKERV